MRSDDLYSTVWRDPIASPPIWSGMGRENVMRTYFANQFVIPCSGCWPFQSLGIEATALNVFAS